MATKLNQVIISFPHVFVAKAFDGDSDEDKKRFSAVFIINKKKQAKLFKAVQADIRKCMMDKWGKKPGSLKICLRPGEEKEELDWPFDEEHVFISASNTRRPPVVGRGLEPITEDDGILYSGCIVNATIDFWAQDNKWGKRINARLRAVQFFKDGKPLTEMGKPVDVDDEFESYEDDLDASDEDDEDDDSLI